MEQKIESPKQSTETKEPVNNDIIGIKPAEELPVEENTVLDLPDTVSNKKVSD